jgi:phosphate:Na+ symporter
MIAGMNYAVSRQIANFHLVFNLAANIVLLPFAGRIAKLMFRFMPDNPEDSFYARKLLYIGKGQDTTPAIMVAQCRQEIFRFADIVRDNYNNANIAFFTGNIELAEKVKERELTINYLNNEIYQYLLRLHGKFLPEGDLETLARMFNILTDLERIGDHADNLADDTISFVTHHAAMSDDAWNEIKDMGDRTVHIVGDAITAYKNRDYELLKSVQREEDEIDAMKERFENNHIDRMRRQACDPRGGTLFVDMIIDYERVGDHSLNIAETLLGAAAPVKI